jgi:iron complex outermembrane recepter protein
MGVSAKAEQAFVLPEVVVRATAVKDAASDTIEPAQNLRGPSLRLKATSTLGATLQDEPGVANASFGPNVGLPIIRGQGGARVRAMVGGLGTHDASNVSADHSVMIEPAMAESIMVWKGPAAIRFGGSALSGAIDVDDGRIPDRHARALMTRAEVRARDGGYLALTRMDGPFNGSLTWHIDAHLREQGNARIPGRAIDEDAVRRQFYLVNAQNTHGFIGNTDAVTQGGSVGASWWGGKAKVGMALSTIRQNHGIPGGAHSHSHTIGPVTPGAVAPPEDVRIDAQQQRLDVKGEWYELPHLDGMLRWRVVHTDYQHDELANGLSMTRFMNQVTEGRADWEVQLHEHWQATLGLHAQDRLFSALGDEAFVPKTQVRSVGAFMLHQLDKGPWRLEAGLRVDAQWSDPLDAQMASQGVSLTLPKRRFQPGSLSVALSRKHDAGSATLTHWHVSRAPEVQELYALGPHLATLTYDMGNSALQAESLKGWDLGLEQAVGRSTVKANAFVYTSDNYIYQQSTGVFYASDEQQFRSLCARLDQCLPVTSYEQAAARLQGYEASWTVPLGGSATSQSAGEEGQVPWSVGVFGDMVRGRLRSGEDLPRMPPRRWGLRLDYSQGPWASAWRITRQERQDHPGANETDTPGSVQLNGSLRWSTQLQGGQRLSYFLIGRNLTNQEIRNSASFLRNYAPEPGRSIEIGMEARL